MIAPLRPAYKVWPDEIDKWEEFKDIRYVILHGKDKDRRYELETDIDIINPEGLEWLRSKPDVLNRYDLIVVDESTKFAESQTKRFKLLKGWLPYFKRRWILTGTLMPNGLEKLFGQIYICDLGRALGQYITHFRKAYFYQSGYGGYDWTPKEDSFSKIVEKVSPLTLMLKAEDHLQMPEVVRQTIKVDLPPSARRVYDEVYKEFISEWDGYDIVAASRAVAGVKCRQVANGAIYVEDREYREIHTAKLDALEDLLEQIGDTPVLLPYEFTHDVKRIQQRLPGCEVLGGSISQKKAESIIDRFNAGELRILCGHPASMGHGLNLQGACNHVIWFGPPWNFEYYDQTNRRIYRQGQKNKTVFLYHLVAERTRDEDVMVDLDHKSRAQTNLLVALAAHRQTAIDVP